MDRRYVIKDIGIFDSNTNMLIASDQTSIDLSNFDKHIIKYTLDYFKVPSYIDEFLDSVGYSKNHKILVNTFIKYGLLVDKTKNKILKDKIYIVSNIKYKSYFNDIIYNNNQVKFINVDESTNFYIPNNSSTLIFLPENPSLLFNILNNYEKYNIQDLIFGNIYLKELWISYLKVPETPCPSCLIKRLSENIPTFKYAVDNELIYDLNNPSYIQIVVGLLLNSIDLLSGTVNTGLTPSISGYLNIMNLDTLKIEKQLIIVTENCECYKKKIKLNDLVGDHVGLIKSIGQVRLEQSDPPVVLLSSKTNTNKSMDSGALDDNWDLCKKRAIGEYLERYCWKNYKDNIKTSCWSDLEHDKRLPIDQFNIYSEKQYTDESFPFKKLTKSCIVDWIEMKNIKSEKTIYVPAELVIGSKVNNSIKLGVRTTTGVAAGPTQKFAIERSILELIERDTVTKSVFLSKKAIEINDSILEEISILNKCKLYGLNPQIFLLENIYKVPVIMCRLKSFDEEDTIISYGYSCELEIKKAVEKSIKEALLMRVDVRKKTKKIRNNSKLKSDYYYLVDETTSFFSNLSIDKVTNINLLKDKVEHNINLLNLNHIYYKNITLKDVQNADTYVVTAWSPYMVDFIKEKKYAPLRIFNSSIDNLNNGYLLY